MKTFSSRITEKISTKLCTLFEGTHLFTDKGPFSSQKELTIFFPLNQHYGTCIIIALRK